MGLLAIFGFMMLMGIMLWSAFHVGGYCTVLAATDIILPGNRLKLDILKLQRKVLMHAASCLVICIVLIVMAALYMP